MKYAAVTRAMGRARAAPGRRVTRLSDARDHGNGR